MGFFLSQPNKRDSHHNNHQLLVKPLNSILTKSSALNTFVVYLKIIRLPKAIHNTA